MENVNLAQIGIEGGVILAAFAILQKQISDISSRVDKLEKELNEKTDDIQTVGLFTATVEGRHVKIINDLVRKTDNINSTLTSVTSYLQRNQTSGGHTHQNQSRHEHQNLSRNSSQTTRGRSVDNDNEKRVRFEESPPRPKLNKNIPVRNVKNSQNGPIIEPYDEESDDEYDSSDIIDDIIDDDEEDEKNNLQKMTKKKKGNKKKTIEEEIKSKLQRPTPQNKQRKSAQEIIAEAEAQRNDPNY